VIAAFDVFMQEHRRCGEIDGNSLGTPKGQQSTRAVAIEPI
jgi:hypothetical protein